MIAYGTYKDQQAVVVENDALRFLFLPEVGANLASAYSKATGREWLVQRPEPVYRRVPFDGSYVDAECSGMDDMMPTIDLCRYERAPWQGALLADHGEVWNLRCDVALTDERVRFSTHGVRLPYHFSKEVSFGAADTLHIAYRAENPTDFDMDFLWAGHTMLNAEMGLRLIVPPECTRAQAVFSNTGRIGRYAEEFDYPVFVDHTGVRRDMSVMGARDRNDEKFYFKEKLLQGYCGVRQPDGATFMLAFPVQTVPYLGILENAGDFMGIYNIFIEPCTAPFDRPDVARCMGKGSVIPARSSYEWYLDITIKEGERGKERGL